MNGLQALLGNDTDMAGLYLTNKERKVLTLRYSSNVIFEVKI